MSDPESERESLSQSGSKGIPEELTEKLGGPEIVQQLAIAVAEQFSGPLPHPRILAQYKDIIPDAPERILSMAERQGDHRIYLEKTVVDQSERRANWGLALGSALALLIAGGSLYLIAVGREVSGLAALLVATLGAIGILMKALRGRRQDLADGQGQQVAE